MTALAVNATERLHMAELVLGTIRGLCALEGIDRAVKIETLTLLAHTDLDTGQCTIEVGDAATLAAACGHERDRP